MSIKSLDSGNLRRDYLRFAAPTVTSLLVFSLYSMVDGIFVGRFVGPEALAAVNLSAPFLNILFSVAVLLAVGSSTLIAAALGAGDRSRADRIFSQNLVTAGVLGLLITGSVLLFLDPLCRLLGAQDAALMAGTRAYVGTLAPFAIFVVLEYNLEVLIKTDGHPRMAAATVLGACLTNVALDWWFVGGLQWGVFGAALATGLSQMLAAGAFLFHFLRGRSRLLRPAPFSFDCKLLARIVPIGFPDGSTELCTGAMTWLYNQAILSRLGSGAVAGFTVITYVNTLMVNLFVGASQGMQPLVSYHLGQRDGAACRRLLRCAMGAQALLGAGAVLLILALAGPVVSVFLPQKGTALWSESTAALRQWSLCFLVMGFNIVSAGYFTARQRPGRAILLSLGRGLFLQAAALGLLLVLGGPNALWSAPLAGELACAVLSLSLLRRDGR